MKLAADKNYLDEALKLMGDAPEYVTSTTLNDDVRKALSISPELKDVHGRLRQAGGKIVNNPYLVYPYLWFIPVMATGCYDYRA